jgi:hypothetical protein
MRSRVIENCKRRQLLHVACSIELVTILACHVYLGGESGGQLRFLAWQTREATMMRATGLFDHHCLGKKLTLPP